MEKPVFKPSFHVETVNPEGVFLLSERGYFVLKGVLYCRLAPLLDGRHTVDDIIDQLTGEATPAEVYYALGLLEKKGYLVEAKSAVPPDRAAFWDALGLDARLAERRLQETTVSLAQFGRAPVKPFAFALGALNIRVGEDGAFAAVLTDDYLQDGLAEFNAAALVAGRTWLLVKPLGTVLWIGPVFRPGQSPCWECLAQRLRVNRAVEVYLQQKKSTTTPFPIARAALPATVQTAFDLAATEVAIAIASGKQAAPTGTLTTLDVLTLETQRHTVVRRPQCPCCGEPAYRSDRVPVPVTLQSQKKRYTADGGHRAILPEQTLAQYEHHVSHLTGAVTVLTRVPVDEGRCMHVYVAGHNLAMKYDSLYFLREGLRTRSGGKGMTDTQARASGLCEALERYSGNFHGDEILKHTSYRLLGPSAIHPNACMLFSEAQYQRRQEWNAHSSNNTAIPVPLDEEAEIGWTPVWSLTAGEFKYLPTGYLYYGYPIVRDACSYWADSNGNAAGNTLEEAILQGFLELVERDSACLWWYNRVRRPAADLDSFDEPYIQELRQQYRKLNRDVWVLDLTSDLRIPAFAAVSRRADDAEERIMLGFGAHFDPRIGVLRALTELNQCAVLASSLDTSAEATGADPVLIHWLKTATLANQPYLAPDDTAPPWTCNYDLMWSDDLCEDVLHCQTIVERQGMEMLVLDQTRPDIGLPVVKVIVPGLRHIYPRLAPGRLYDVPVKLGWLREPLAEEQLNPVASIM
jgi:bacteriocin biosynthesis cyclodehydratase domain-containing protein